MNFQVVRVGIEYNGVRKAIVFPKVADKKEMLSSTLSLFSLPKDRWDEFTLMIQLLDCPVENADILQDNEWLCLKELINNDNNLDSMNSINKHIEGEKHFNIVARKENPDPKFPQQSQKILLNLRRMDTNSFLHSFRESNNSDEEIKTIKILILKTLEWKRSL